MLHVGSAPSSHSMTTALNGDDLTRGAHAMHCVAHRSRLIVRNLIIFRTVYAQEWRHPFVHHCDRSHGAQLCEALLIGAVRTEEANTAAVRHVATESRHVVPLGMVAPLDGDLG